MKTKGVGGERGYDGAKKVKGRKRHLLVDTEGLVIKAKVHMVAKAWWTRRGSRSCSMVPRSCSRVFLTCGLMLVTGAKRKAEVGWKRCFRMECATGRRSPHKPAPEEVLMRWAKELAKEAKMVEVGRSFCQRGHFRSSHGAGRWNAHPSVMAKTEG